MTHEEKRAKDAERKRIARAKAAAERDAARAAAKDAADASAATTMRDAVKSAIEAAKWLVPSDAASVAQAHELARQIDEHTAAGDAVKAMSAHRALSRVLNDLGATPAARMHHELRSQRSSKTEVPDGNEGKVATGGAVVSQLKRPTKRRRA